MNSMNTDQSTRGSIVMLRLPEVTKRTGLGKTHLYRHFDAGGALLYVGVSLSAVTRLGQHADHSHWFSLIARVTIEAFPSRAEALAAEQAAIAKENPQHNIRRPSTREQAAGIVASAKDLLARVVRFNPIYSEQEAAQVLGINTGGVKRLIEAGALGSVMIPTGRGGVHRKVTGWQLISYLESLGGTPRC